MTTVAWDGRTMSADTLATDSWGLKEEVRDKVKVGVDFLCGMAGENGRLTKWFKTVAVMNLDQVLNYGYPEYDRDSNDPAIILAGHNGRIYRHVAGGFFKCSRPFHAVGSGRDFALGAMQMAADSRTAVLVAMAFDNGTGGEVMTWELPK